ncbi:tyrosine-type recombinase/integrase [Intrasporangium sp. DVR]|uniref:tyrosine-type recombinase/integrase n=1 Tax=Intrasporangium sp. DVR TaxID=3127867 RepID=UPI00313A5DEA
MTRRANGEGSVYQTKGGRWVGATYADTNTGGRKRVVVYGRSRPEARKKLEALQKELDAGVLVAVENWTVQAYLEHWLETVVKPNRAPKTYQGYELVVRLHLGPRIGKKKLRALTVRDVRLMCQHLAAAGMQRRGVQFAHAVLRAGLQNAMRDELLTRNVAKLVQVPAPEYVVGQGLKPDEAKKLLAAAKTERLHALYVLALYLGLRRGELLGLQWQHVDLDGETLQVVQSLQRVGGQLQLKAPKTRKSRRTVPLPLPVVEALKAHKIAQGKERLAAGPNWHDTGMVFASAVGTPMEPDNLRRSWYRVREILPEPRPRLHDLRHTCVTLLLTEGVAPHIVQEIVGHSAIDVTMTIYAHTSLEEKRKALALLGDRLA